MLQGAGSTEGEASCEGLQEVLLDKLRIWVLVMSDYSMVVQEEEEVVAVTWLNFSVMDCWKHFQTSVS